MGLSREQVIRRLVVALDTSDEEAIVALAHRLAGHVGMLKVGLEAYTAAGPRVVARVREVGLPVFLDLKLHDIPNTVERAAANCARFGVTLFNVHAAGGPDMVRAAAVGAAAGTPAGGRRPGLLAVTVLTSLDEPTLERLGMPGNAQQRALDWAAMSREAGADGVVCSPRELTALRQRLGAEFILLAPGIRPVGSAVGDQKRVATPAAALADGADFIVVGRPITGAADPVAAAAALVDEVLASATGAGSAG